jgi:hypothetical protein
MMQAITGWTRRTASSFGEVRSSFTRSAFPVTTVDAPAIAGDRVYRLRNWPNLPVRVRTAEVLRLLSLMSSRPLRRSWIVAHTRMGEGRVDALMKRLAAQNALEVFELSRLPAEQS